MIYIKTIVLYYMNHLKLSLFNIKNVIYKIKQMLIIYIFPIEFFFF